MVPTYPLSVWLDEYRVDFQSLPWAAVVFSHLQLAPLCRHDFLRFTALRTDYQYDFKMPVLLVLGCILADFGRHAGGRGGTLCYTESDDGSVPRGRASMR
jgi:hypothetical protein